MGPAAACLAVALWAPPAGDPPTWVAQAIAWGASQEAVDFPSAKGSHAIRYSTPYLRVAQAAHEAQRRGRPLDPASVPADLVASELHVFAGMLPIGRRGGRIRMAGAATVILLVDGEGRKPSRVESEAISMSVGKAGEEMQPFEGRQLKAAFPLTLPIPAEARAIVEYAWVEDHEPRRTERTYKLDLKKVSW
jgi:hypothetical protein